MKDYVGGKITSTEISHIPMKVLIEKDKKTYDKESVLLCTRIIYRVENIKAFVKANRKLLTNKEINKSLKRVTKHLYKIVKKLK